MADHATILPLERLHRALPELAPRYQANQPTPHIQVPSFLDEDHARPGDGWRVLPIGLDKKAVSVYSALERRWGLSDDFASKVLGWPSRRRGK